MTENDDVNDQQDDSRMNLYAVISLAGASPLFVLALLGHEWAKIALKVYFATLIAVGSILMFLERDSLKSRWLWFGMVPVTILHALAMYGLVSFNETFPQIDRFPVAAYGLLVLAAALECGILYVLLERFRPKQG